MLLRFAVSNYYSLRDLQVLNLTASSLKDDSQGLIECPASPTGSILPAIVIYGANASGKTNFISAMDMMRGLVLYSHTSSQPDDLMPYHPFLLDDANSNAPTHFEADFVIEGVRYHYGFKVSKVAFDSEWLYAIPKSRSRLLFEREGDQFRFGRELKGQNRKIADMTRSNSLFVSAAAQNSHKQLSKIFTYFKSIRRLMISTPHGLAVSLRLREVGPDPRIFTFLENIDTGVIGYDEWENQFSDEIGGVLKDMSDILNRHVGDSEKFDSSSVDMQKVIKLAHRGATGERVYFDLDVESSGTRRLLILLSEVFRALDEGSPIYIDELDTSLHTHASEAVVSLFCSPEVNRNGAQLIATTHDTNLMKSSLLRRDQPWLTEKTADGSTVLFPLTDFRTRAGDDIERGYLQGRFGAVPSDNPIQKLGPSA